MRGWFWALAVAMLTVSSGALAEEYQDGWLLLPKENIALFFDLTEEEAAVIESEATETPEPEEGFASPFGVSYRPVVFASPYLLASGRSGLVGSFGGYPFAGAFGGRIVPLTYFSSSNGYPSSYLFGGSLGGFAANPNGYRAIPVRTGYFGDGVFRVTPRTNGSMTAPDVLMIRNGNGSFQPAVSFR